MVEGVLELSSTTRIKPTWREWRWMVNCPGDRIASIAEDEQAWARLRSEEKLIATLAEAGCRVPKVTRIDQIARLQVRSRLRGISGYAVEALVFGESSRIPAAVRYRPNSPLTDAGPSSGS